MKRRAFVRSALATAGAGLAAAQAQQAPGQHDAPPPPEYYQLRRYTLRSGPQLAQLQEYLGKAMIPALGELFGMRRVGAFKLDIGPETPTVYVLLPSASLETLAAMDRMLARDPAYARAAAAFEHASPAAPAFVREERSLLAAFSGWPQVQAPKPGRRIFQLRTYESPTQGAHLRKVAMFNEAEIAIFLKNGLNPVFFGQTLVGTRMPSLTYMLTFADVAELNAHWAAFGADPAWQELSHRPGNGDGELVSNISNLYLSPLECSQI